MSLRSTTSKPLLFWHTLFTALCFLLCVLWTPLSAQIVVPDRLPNGNRMSAVTTPAEFGVLPFDTLRTLPENQGGRDTWWHRHAVFTDGAIQMALDPVLVLSMDRLLRDSEDPNDSPSGFRNIRGVRYSGSIDGRIRFGGKVLEMQRVLVSPETEAVLNAQAYPGMGTGKLRPTEGNLYKLDHSLAEVWFDAQPHKNLRLQWGLGSSGLGPGAQNILWNGARAPAPYFLAAVNLGKGWVYRWVQSRQKGPDRLPANGAREGRYRPLGLGIRSLTKSFHWNNQSLDITVMVARWTDVMERSQNGKGAAEWLRALAPWVLPLSNTSQTPWYLSGHQGLDVQWRRPKSTWYGQLRHHPWRDQRFHNTQAQGNGSGWQGLVGHVRHGNKWSIWTEVSPVNNSVPSEVHPGIPGSSLGIERWSSLTPYFIQGAEWRLAGITLAAELGLPQSERDRWRAFPGWRPSWKATISIPSAAADPPSKGVRRLNIPNHLWPPLVPLAPFFSYMQTPGWYGGPQEQWWSVGVTSPLFQTRKNH